ncbi:hypothetical protein RDABS01_018922 [Bienertia sinuspersici]
MSKSIGKNDVSNDVVEVILASDWSDEVGSKLKKIDFPLSEDFLFEVIRKLREEPLKALKFFEWFADCKKYKHDSVTYSGMATILARCGLIDEFWDLVTRMRSEGYEIDSYAKISKSLRNEDAVKLFEIMMDGPCKLSEPDCVLLLKKLALDSDPDISLVNRVVNKYFKVRNNLTKAIYDNVHRSLCKVGRFDEAKKIVEDMKNAGYKPDSTTYSQEVFGLCNMRRFEDASMVLKRMEEEGCIPDIITWTVLIQCYGAAGLVDQALSFFAQMLEKNFKPNADLYLVLLNGFLSHNRVLDAYKFLVEVFYKVGPKPWQATYKLVIDKLMEDGKLEEAFNLLDMMKEQGYSIYVKSVVEYISKFGTLEDEKKLLGALSMNGVPPSTSAYEQQQQHSTDSVSVLVGFFQLLLAAAACSW